MTNPALADLHVSVLKALRRLREERGISQVELAQRLGRTQPFVSLLERGERRIDVIEFCAICRAIGLDPAQTFAEVVASLPPLRTM